ncbi:MAG: hypothetical protein J7M38_12925 [Armatimonadetes bacterium]|nr:hypothetical protein [Armatimonadota bacterium]
MKLTSDWHIHSEHSCDSASLPMADLAPAAASLGITDYGVTDHIHTPCNLPDLEASREAYLATGPSPRFHFGVEVSCVSQWELDELASRGCDGAVYGLRRGGPPGAEPAIGIDREDIERLGIEFVVAGVHWPMYLPFERDVIIRDYHRQNMFLAAHPLVDIVAHPWWWMGGWKDDDGRYTSDPWLDDFGKIPRTMHDEFAAAAVEHDTAVEINLDAILLSRSYPETFAGQYLEYLAYLRDRGVVFSIGSDCHSAQYAPDFERAGEMLEGIGLRDEQMWRLPPRGAAG